MSGSRHHLGGWAPPPAELAPPLEGAASHRVAIIGGGLTGLVAALRLAEAGVDTAILEREFCGFGASSRNAGHLSPTISGDPLFLLARHPLRAKQLLAFADGAVDFTEKLIGRHGIDCDYVTSGNVYAALTAAQLRRTRWLGSRLQQLGADVAFVEEDGPSAVGLPHGFLGGLRERRGGLLNPGKLCLGLRRSAGEAGVALYERTAVEQLSRASGKFVIRTPHGLLEAGQLLVASNAYSPQLGIPTPGAVQPLWVTLVESEQLEAERLRATGWTSGAGIYTQHLVLENYRPTARDTIVFGTRFVEHAGRAMDRGPSERIVGRLVDLFHERFPELGDVGAEHAWGGWIAMTGSSLPLVGALAPGAYYALGYNGHGLAQAPYLGHLIAGRMLGVDDQRLEPIWRTRRAAAPPLQTSRPVLRAAEVLDKWLDRGLRHEAARAADRERVAAGSQAPVRAGRAATGPSAVIAAHLAAGRMFRAGGTRSFVRESGAGTPVVLLHGEPASSFVYRKVLPLLAGEGFRAVAFDFPGLGLAGRPLDFDYSTTGLACFTAAALDALGIERCHLVVHDIGGPIGCEWAVHNPGRVLSLTVLNTTLNLASYRDPWSLQVLRFPLLGELWNRLITPGLFARFFYRDGVGDSAAVSRDEAFAYFELLQGSDRGRAFLKVARGFELSADKEQLICDGLARRQYPAQIVWGEHDPVLRAEHREFVQGVLGIEDPLLLPAKHFLQEDQAPAIASAVAELARRADRSRDEAARKAG